MRGVRITFRLDHFEGGEVRSLFGKQLLHGTKQPRHVFRASGVAHQADAPYLAFEFTKPAADFDAVTIQECSAQQGFVGPRRKSQRIELW